MTTMDGGNADFAGAKTSHNKNSIFTGAL